MNVFSIIKNEKDLLENINLLEEQVNNKDNTGYTPLMHCAKIGNINTVKLLLDIKNINIDIQSNYGYTALMCAVISDSVDIVELLLSKNANIDLQNNTKMTALMYASKNGNIKIVKLLINANASIDKENNTHQTALMLTENQEIIEFLIEKGADYKQLLQKNFLANFIYKKMTLEIKNIIFDYEEKEP
jgi:ankyrin repeat protein